MPARKGAAMARPVVYDIDQGSASRLPIDTPGHAAAEILPMFATMPNGVVLLLLDADRIPLAGLAIRNAPRNDFGPIVELLTAMEHPRPHSVVLGVLSGDAVVDDDAFVFGEHDDVGERLTLEAATVQAWAAFAFDLRCAGLVLLDVIECSSWGWASVHAPTIPYAALRLTRTPAAPGNAGQ